MSDKQPPLSFVLYAGLHYDKPLKEGQYHNEGGQIDDDTEYITINIYALKNERITIAFPVGAMITIAPDVETATKAVNDQEGP